MGRRASEVEISDSLILALVRARRPNNSEKKKKPLSSPKKGERGDLLYPPELPPFFLGEETNPSEWYKKKKKSLDLAFTSSLRRQINGSSCSHRIDVRGGGYIVLLSGRDWRPFFWRVGCNGSGAGCAAVCRPVGRFLMKARPPAKGDEKEILQPPAKNTTGRSSVPRNLVLFLLRSEEGSDSPTALSSVHLSRVALLPFIRLQKKKNRPLHGLLPSVWGRCMHEYISGTISLGTFSLCLCCSFTKSQGTVQQKYSYS